MKRLMRAAVVMAGLAVPSFAATPAEAAKPVAPQVQPVVAEKKAGPELDVVFVLDTTGSMGGLIEGAKQKIWSIASRMAQGTPSPKIRVGLVAYRDRGDAYVTKRFDLSDNLDAVYANLRGFQADGGGDGPEHVGRGLGEAVKFMSWSQSSKASRMIFVVGDAPPHDDYQDEWNTKVWAKKAIAQGIVVNTIRCGDQGDTAMAFQEMSKLADGSFVSIGQSGGMVAVATPYDDEIGRLNGDLATHTVFAGGRAAREESVANNVAQAALAPSVAADRGSYRKMKGLSTFGAEASAGSVDLAAAPEKLKEMKADALPEPMQKMTESERVAYVKQQAEARQKVEARLREATEKRTAWLAENAKTKKDSFDEQVFESVKKSAAKVGVTY